jgi:hypothetical protein
MLNFLKKPVSKKPGDIIPVQKIGINDIAKELSSTPLYKNKVSTTESMFLQSPSWLISDKTKISKLPYGNKYPEIYEKGLSGINAANQYYHDYGASKEAKEQYDLYKSSLGGKKNKKNKNKKSKTKKSKTKKNKKLKK